jgi:hypothetical protein
MDIDHIRRTTSSGAGKLVLALIALAVLAAGAQAAVHGHRATTRAPFSIGIVRGSGHLAAGGVTRYKLLIDRHGPSRGRARGAHPRRAYVGVVALSIGTVPRGATVSISPKRTRGSMTVLTVRTNASTPANAYRLLVRGRSGRYQAVASLPLVVSGPINPPAPPGASPPANGPRPPLISSPPTPVVSPSSAVAPPANRPITLAGNLEGILTPGQPLPLNVTLTNPDPVNLYVTGLTVSVSAISAPHADASHPCTVGDFASEQFSGADGLTVPASTTTTLAALGFAPAQWPWVGIVDRPVNQDGCKGASLTLSYSATAVAP